MAVNETTIVQAAIGSESLQKGVEELGTVLPLLSMCSPIYIHIYMYVYMYIYIRIYIYT